MKRIAWFAVLIAASAMASAQFSTGFEAPTYTGSSGGTTLTGQDGWYLPAAGGVDFNVYTYAGNAPGVAANPTGGTQFAAGIAATTPARAQHDMDFSSADVWSFSYDILGMYTGQLPAANNLGSFSAQDSATTQSFIALNVWDDVNTAASWSAQYNVYDSAGTALNGQSAGAAWTNLTPNHWYRQETQVNFATHQITKVSITDLTTMVTTTFNPTDWYLQGGASSALPRPTGFRMFAGAAGNLMAFDNLVVPEPGTMAVLGLGLLAALRKRRSKA